MESLGKYLEIKEREGRSEENTYFTSYKLHKNKIPLWKLVTVEEEDGGG